MQQRNGSLDSLRILACLSVILLHSAAGYIYKFKQIPLEEWQIANLIDSITRWCVPVFVLMSGALNINSKNVWGSGFIRKRLTKIVPILIFWVAIYIYFLGVSDPKFIAYVILIGYPYYHLYFLFVILVLYLMTPAISSYSTAVGEAKFRSTGVFCLIFTVLAMAISVPKFNAMTLALPFVGYYLLGGPIMRSPIPVKLARIGFVASVLCTTIGTWVLVERYGVENGGIRLYDFWAPNIALMSVCIFSIFTQFNIKHSKILNYFSGVTLGVYLIHVMVLESIQSIMSNHEIQLSALPTIIIQFAATSLISFTIAAFIGKVPVLRRLVS